MRRNHHPPLFNFTALVMFLAELNENNQVVSIHETYKYLLWNFVDPDMTEEQKAVVHMRSILGEDVKLVETRETNEEGSFRERMAEIGGTYDYEGEYFISKQPHASWEYNIEKHDWFAPVEHPNTEAANLAGLTIEELEYQNKDISTYWWDEDQLDWIELKDE